MGAEFEVGVDSQSPLGGIRSILFRPDLVAVVPWPRVPRPPAPVRRVTPLRSRPTGEAIERARGGEWFSDRIFVEAKPNRLLTGLCTSIGTHALVIALAAALPSRVALIPVSEAGSRLVMPAMLVLGSIADAPVQTTGLTARSPQAPPQLRRPREFLLPCRSKNPRASRQKPVRSARRTALKAVSRAASTTTG